MNPLKLQTDYKRASIGRVSNRNCEWPFVSHIIALTKYRELRLELNLVNHSVWDLTYPPYFPSPPQDLKTQAEAAWYFYLAEIALRRLGNRILNYVCRSKASHTTPASMIGAVLNFEQQATDW